MLIKDELVELICALSMQEKRHFKLFARRYTRDKSNYIKLFDAIASQRVYNEQKIKNKLKNEVFVKHLAFEKHRLHHLINKALRLYHTGKGIDLLLKELLIDAEILHEKSLYAQCRKTLNRARALANKYERFVFIPEITRLESRLFDLDSLEEVYKEEAAALRKMQVINSYRSLSNKVALLVSATHRVRKKTDMQHFDKWMKSPIMQQESRADTFTARVYYFYIKAVYYEMKGDVKSGYRSRHRFVELIEKDAVQMQVHAKNYLSALNNLAISELELGLFEEAKKTAEKIKRLPARGEDVEVMSFIFSTIVELNIGIRAGDFAGTREALPQIEKRLAKFEEKIQEQFKVVIFNSIKYIYFGAGDLRASLKWSNRIINEANANVRRDIQAMSRIFNLILHYELGNSELLEHILRSTYRFLRKTDHLYKVETVLLNYLRKAMYLDTKKQIERSFAELYRELIPLTRNKYEKKAFEEFDLIAWLRSKIEGKPFAFFVKERAFGNKNSENSLKSDKK